MKKNVFKAAYLSATLLSFMLFSCSGNDEFTDLNPLENPDKEVSYGAFDDLAKTLALSLKDEILQDFLKEEAELQIDGDYDILFAEVLNKKVESSTELRSSGKIPSTFKDYLESKLITKSSNQIDIEQMCNEILAKDPLIQIAIPNIENP